MLALVSSRTDAEVSIIGFKTIASMCPAVFVIEIGATPCQRSLETTMEKSQETIQSGAAMDTIQTVWNLTPKLLATPLEGSGYST